MDALFAEFKISRAGPAVASRVDRVDAVVTARRRTFISSKRGITEAGAMASFHRRGPRRTRRGVPVIPFLTLLFDFGFQRVASDLGLLDQRGKASCRRYRGRTTLSGECCSTVTGHR